MKHIKRDFRSKACVSPPWWTYGAGLKGQDLSFSEHSHVAYQIKGNHECNSMVANNLPTDPYPPTLSSVPEVKIQPFWGRMLIRSPSLTIAFRPHVSIRSCTVEHMNMLPLIPIFPAYVLQSIRLNG